MLQFWFSLPKLFLFLSCIKFIKTNKVQDVIGMGGYTARMCLNMSSYNLRGNTKPSRDNDIKYFRCERSNNETCVTGWNYHCLFPCKLSKKFMINNQIITLNIKNLTFDTDKRKIYYNKDTLELKSKVNLLLLKKKEIFVVFPNESNISCPAFKISENYIICTLNMNFIITDTVTHVNITVKYGFEYCKNSIFVGTIKMWNPPWHIKILNKYYWIFIVVAFVIILLICVLIFLHKIKTSEKKAASVIKDSEKKLVDQEVKYCNTQKKAFLEYQTAVSSFPDLGSLTPMHILSFYNYVSRVFNIELPMESSMYKNYKSEKFAAFILDKDKLIKWIDRVEKECKLQQRSLIASLLTIVLFQHPEYFLEIIKSLLVKYIKKLKENNEEKLLFRRSEAIVEKMIGNWITLCMYQNLKTGEVGKKFFYLFRAIKCKMNQGLVDCITNKAKYALTFDHIMLGDIDYDVLNIKADVEVNLKMMNNVSGPLSIHLKNIDVQVLSLDSISQVKEKILDKAIMFYSEKENIDDNRENSDLCLGLNDLNDFKLQLINNTTKIMLDDFDQTSVRSETENDCLMMNTMKHYNLKTGTKFLLNSIKIVDNILPIEPHSILNQKLTKVHLHLPQDYKTTNVVTELQKQHSNEVQSKKTFSPVVEDVNKEAYLMRLLAIKQSMIVFIEGFFQSIFNWNPKQINNVSSNSLFVSEERILLLDSMNLDSQSLLSKEMYLSPIFFLFSMLDDIACSLGITDTTAISLWKSNSFILRFWVNMIKNPNFIFSVDKSGAIGGSLTTIASVLMESCSMSSNTLIDVNLPIVKQLFLKELKEYSSWWRSFTESATLVKNSVIVTQMKDIIETYSMINQYNSSLTSLEAIANTLIPELSTLEEDSHTSQ